MLVNDQLQALAGLPRGKNPSKALDRLLGPRADLEAFNERKISCL